MMINSPESILSSPPMALSRVDLPLPDLPRMNTIPDSGKEILILSSALTLSPVLER